jgi:hypothetical protein
MSTGEQMSPARTAERYGHTRAFWTALIEAGELPARDERLPGRQRPRYVIDSEDVDRWKESRVVSPAVVSRRRQGQQPQRPPVARVSGVLARMREAKRARTVAGCARG